MDIDKILSLVLIGDSKPSEEKEEDKEADNVIDKVIKKNKKTFDELAKY